MTHTARMIALLRGVNVGGITVKSAPLAATFAEQGFTGVRTVLASGNVAFDATDGIASAGLADLKGRIELALQQAFGYDAWIVLVSGERMARIAAGYPFARADDTHHPYVVFSSDENVAAELLASSGSLTQEEESIASGDGVLYWRVPRGSTLNSPFAKLLAKSRFTPYITTRNLRTVEKLATA
ncbi:DUF1697 domain-containing protein [Parafrigoribacterium mesophilum]|uniref:DUF1697 domain-containing protein n=1 Tax=Parafrigoribacterium mesophilum TaxID=433646 RepID=UPI0031FDF727